MGQETTTPTTAALQSDCQAQLTLLQNQLAICNRSLTNLGITNIAANPTIATTLAAVNAVTL
jgi:hypothetical protein